MSKIYFDVGANNGKSMIHYAEDYNNIVYAFEPARELAAALRCRMMQNPNYYIIEKAVADYQGKSTFHLAARGDWGSSSLNHFSENLDKTWPGITCFQVTDSYEVEVIRLEDFVVENQIHEIEYLHIDVQGKDLEVLMGLGSKISIVKAGVIEMPISHQTKLYKDQKYLMDDAKIFLEENGFQILRIESNDQFGNEVNIYFERRS